ncbi:MAG: hypothetical protein ACR2M5_03490 [Nakamurella sp.]
MEQFFNQAQASSDHLLDAIDLLLKATKDPGPWGGRNRGADNASLESALSVSGSLWTVNPGGDGIVERIDSTAMDQAKTAAGVEDIARDDLLEAWNRAYGRDPDASDAWDHSIKAVEHIYSPLVLSAQAANDQSTLGKVIGQLAGNRAGWTAEIVTDPNDPSSGVDVIRSMMQALWGNPDRHGGGASWRAPELAEAQALVQIAVTLVQWGRQGVLRKRAKP